MGCCSDADQADQQHQQAQRPANIPRRCTGCGCSMITSKQPSCCFGCLAAPATYTSSSSTACSAGTGSRTTHWCFLLAQCGCAAASGGLREAREQATCEPAAHTTQPKESAWRDETARHTLDGSNTQILRSLRSKLAVYCTCVPCLHLQAAAGYSLACGTRLRHHGNMMQRGYCLASVICDMAGLLTDCVGCMTTTAVPH